MVHVSTKITATDIAVASATKTIRGANRQKCRWKENLRKIYLSFE